MKGLKSIIILGLIALIALSWYTLFNDAKSQEIEYLQHIDEARSKAQMGIYTDANTSYMSALGMHKNLNLKDEIADYYLSSGQVDFFIEECLDMISQYPKEETGYEKLVEYYYGNEAFEECFTVIDKANKRNIKSASIDTILQAIHYTYKTKRIKISQLGIISDGLVTIQDENGNWGYFSEYGMTTIGCLYRQAAPFSFDGYASVFDQNGELFLINKYNEKKFVDVEKKNIEECNALSYGLMAAKIDGKYSYLDINFKVQFGEYDFAGTFHNGMAAVQEKEGWSIINTSNEKISKSYYADIKLDLGNKAFRNSLAFVSLDGRKYFLVNSEDEKVGEMVLEDAFPFITAEPTAIKKDGKWGFMDKEGNMIIEPRYEDARPFCNGLAAVKVDGKWGYIDLESFELVIPAEFNEAREMSAYGISFVRLKSEWHVLSLYKFNH